MSYFNMRQRISGFFRCLPTASRLVLIFTFLVTIPVVSMAMDEQEAVDTSLPEIVVSIEPLYEIVASIAHQVVQPEVVYLTMSDIHKPLSEQQKAMLHSADIIIRVGQGFEPYLDAYIQAQGKVLKNKTITLSLYIPLLDKQYLEGEENRLFTDRQASSDLRFWMDPRLVKMLTIYIAPKLVAMDPEHTEEYLDNEVLVKEQLRKVEQKMLALFQQMSVEQKILIARFNPYLKNRYMSFSQLKAVNKAMPDTVQEQVKNCLEQHAFDTIPLNLEYTEKSLYTMVQSLQDCTQPHLSPMH